MKAVKTSYCNKVFTSDDPSIHDLHVELYRNDAGNTLLTSFWKPTPEEIQGIVEGKLVMLSILGTQHPPVKVHVLKDAIPS